MEKIEEELYSEIASRVVIPCVDVILYKLHKGKREVLLLRRAEEPAFGCLYPIGGAIRKGEFSESAAVRKVKGETGIDARIVRMFGVYETIYGKAQHHKTKNGLHTINQGFFGVVKENERVTLDNTSSDYEWIKESDVGSLPDYSRQLIQDSGVFSGATHSICHRSMNYRCYDFSPFSKLSVLK